MKFLEFSLFLSFYQQIISLKSTCLQICSLFYYYSCSCIFFFLLFFFERADLAFSENEESFFESDFYFNSFYSGKRFFVFFKFSDLLRSFGVEKLEIASLFSSSRKEASEDFFILNSDFVFDLFLRFFFWFQQLKVLSIFRDFFMLKLSFFERWL